MDRRRPIILAVGLAFAASLGLPAQDSRVTPDQPGFVNQVTQEQLDLALAFSPGERIVRLTEISDRRVQEIKGVLDAKRYELVAPLANAYLRLIADGVQPLIQQAEQKGLELTANLVAVERIARKHPVQLDERMLQAPVEMEGVMQRATDAAKQHLALVRASVARAKRARGDLGGGEEAGAEDGGADAGASKGGEGFGFDLRDFNKPGTGSGGSSNDDRRKGRGD